MKSIVLNLVIVAVAGCLVISSAHAAPPDKDKLRTKLKPVLSEKEGSKITEEERRFIKEVEAKFKINNKENDKAELKKILEKKTKGLKLPFPAVIAIEIVNDTTPDGKGKRTIDANLGYGYKTDNGYFYQKFGPSEEKGKFMIYPYSQHDIPASSGSGYNSNSHYSNVYTNKQTGEKTYVDIQPSKAFQLVPVDSNDHQETQNTYNPNDVVSYLRTKYESVQAVETPPPPQYSAAEDYYQQHTQTESPTTFYSTFNDHGQLSGFSGHFPSVMSNYYVNPSQLVGHSSFQGYNGQQHEELVGPKRVIPVFILRIPSSQISHEHASAFNQLNLQALVSQYLAHLQPSIIPKVVPTQQAYYHQRPVYSTPSSVSHYSVPQSQYVPSDYSEYSQPQQYEEGQGEQHVQYVPQYRPKSRIPNIHTTFSQVYNSLSKGGQRHQPIQHEHTENYSETLPISENYPDHEHTQVVFKPQYSNEEQSYQEGHMSEYSTQAPKSTYSTPEQSYRTTSYHQPQISIVHNGHAVQEDNQGHYEQASYDNTQEDASKGDEAEQQYYQPVEEQHYQPSTQEDTQTPYNYHAHPFPKRQIKGSDSGSKRQSQRNRRPLRSGAETAVKTKL